MPEPTNPPPHDPDPGSGPSRREGTNGEFAGLVADDASLLAYIAETLDELDPPPDSRAAAAVAWSTRFQDAALAELTSDSRDATAGARAFGDETGEWLATFVVAGVTIDLSLTPVDRGLRLLGQLHGHAGPVTIDLLARGSTDISSLACETDALGRFRAGPLPTSRVRVRAGSGVGSVATPWFVI